MGRQSIEGFSYQGALEDFDTLTKLARKRFVTVMPLGTNRSALDVITNGLFVSGAGNRVVEVGSTDSLVVLTAHGAFEGDVIRLNTTANTISQQEIAIKEIVDANSFLLEGRLDADLTAGDTFDIMRGVSQTFTSSGGITTGPIQFTLDGTDVTVNEDTVTPANNRPLPVKLTGVTGDINITAGDLNVQLQHTGATPDSVQIGDGTEILLINADGSLNATVIATDLDIRDLAASQDNVAISDGTDTLAINADGSINTTISATDLDIRDLSQAQDSVAIGDGTDIVAISAAGAMSVESTDLDIRDLAASQDNVAISDGINTLAVNGGGSINVVATATDLDIRDLAQGQDSVAIGDGTDIVAVSAAGALSVEATDLDVRDLAASQDNVAISDGTDTLAVNADGSINVVASSSPAVGSRQFIRNDYSGTNVTTGAFVELTAALTQAMSQAEIFDSSGQTLEIATGSGGSEVVRFRVFPGGNGFVPLDNTIFAAAERVSIRAVSANATAGEININFYA